MPFPGGPGRLAVFEDVASQVAIFDGPQQQRHRIAFVEELPGQDASTKTGIDLNPGTLESDEAKELIEHFMNPK